MRIENLCCTCGKCRLMVHLFCSCKKCAMYASRKVWKIVQQTAVGLSCCDWLWRMASKLCVPWRWMVRQALG